MHCIRKRTLSRIESVVGRVDEPVNSTWESPGSPARDLSATTRMDVGAAAPIRVELDQH